MEIGKHLESLAIGRPRIENNLCVWPLFARRVPASAPGSLSAALLDGACSASPLRAPGRLPAWLIRNPGGVALFAAAGETLSAAGKTRLLQHSVLVPARGCLELPATWLGAPGPHPPDSRPGNSRWVPGQVGNVFCVDGVVRAMEWFGDPELCRRAGSASLARFLRSAAASRHSGHRVIGEARLAEWIRRLMAVPMEPVPTLGDGQSHRPVSGRLVGQCLTAGGRLVHARFSEARRIRTGAVRSLMLRRVFAGSVRQVTLADPWAG